MSLPVPPGQAPRQWQIDAMQAARVGLGRFRAGVISAATGTGKGTLISGLALLAAAKGKRVLMLAHREELVTELPDRVQRADPSARVGLVLGADTHGLALPIISASVQSLGGGRLARILKWGAIDFVITDECHHATAPTYQAVYDAVGEVNAGYKHLGFTATPFRSAGNGDIEGIGRVYDALLYEYGITDAIAAGDLVPIRGYQVETQLSIEGLRTTRSGDFAEKELAERIDCQARNDVIVDQYQERTPGASALVFAASVEHARHIAQRFQARGVDARAVWGDMPKHDRRALVADYKEGRLPVLVSRDLLFEGFDAPRTMAIYKARPTQSRIVFQQMIGRGLRLFPGKEELVFVDLVDNGCDLDLATIHDLSEADEAEALPPADIPDGARVQLRLAKPGDPVGVVQATEDGVVSVYWADRNEVSTHSRLDLRYAQEATDEIRIEPKVRGVQAYEITLLANGRRAGKVPWYQYRGGYYVGGEDEQDRRVQLGVVPQDDEWMAAALVTTVTNGRYQTERHTIGYMQSRDDALKQGEQWIADQSVKLSKIRAEWKQHPATDKQIRALEKWRIRRDLSRISRGEASALLDAVITKSKLTR